MTESFHRFPALDTVLGHAGGCGLHPFATTSEADYDRIFRFNYFAQVNLARAVFAQWIERKIPGHLIFTSSYVARVPHTKIPSYASAKAALENFARCMALEYAADWHSRQRGLAGKRRGRQFAESLRRRSRLQRIRAAGFSGQTKQSGIDRRCVRVSLLAAGQRDQRPDTQSRLRRRHRQSLMKIGLGLYRHMLTRDYYDFARQAGCTHVVVHLVDYFNQGASNPRNNQPTGGKVRALGNERAIPRSCGRSRN